MIKTKVIQSHDVKIIGNYSPFIHFYSRMTVQNTFYKFFLITIVLSNRMNELHLALRDAR